MALPRVSIAHLQVSRLMAGGGAISGISHQHREADQAMMNWFTAARVLAHWRTCEACGINTFLARADTHIMRLLRDHWNDGGTLQWFAQTAPEYRSLQQNIQRAAEHGAAAIYLHGGWFEQHWTAGEFDLIEQALDWIRATGKAVGVGSHLPQVHLAVSSRLELDFQMVCVHQCGSVHAGGGERFDPADVPLALEAIRNISRPCIAYKVLGAGRYLPGERLPLVYHGIKPTDPVLIGFYPEHHPTQVEDTVAMVERILREVPTAQT